MTREEWIDWYMGKSPGFRESRLVSAGISFNPIDPPPDPILIYGSENKVIMRMDRSGNVELWGDVNEAALRFWNAVCQLSGGTLTKHKEGITAKGTLGII